MKISKVGIGEISSKSQLVGFLAQGLVDFGKFSNPEMSGDPFSFSFAPSFT